MLQACFLFANLLAPSLAGVNHLLESLGILLWAVVALENVRSVHICFVFVNLLQRYKTFWNYCSFAPTFFILLRRRLTKSASIAKN